MREIKFRAWARRGEWEEDGEHQKFIMLGADVLAFEEFAPISELLQDVDDDFYLMQYTGRKDRNGKEIYDGDIGKSRSRLLSSLWEVYWDERVCQFRVCANHDRQFDKTHTIDWVDEIVGNIYENPELITPAETTGPKPPI